MESGESESEAQDRLQGWREELVGRAAGLDEQAGLMAADVSETQRQDAIRRAEVQKRDAERSAGVVSQRDASLANRHLNFQPSNLSIFQPPHQPAVLTTTGKVAMRQRRSIWRRAQKSSQPAR